MLIFILQHKYVCVACFQIASDPVGFGFVVRGEGPTYVKTVDPTGPAAQSGLRVSAKIHLTIEHMPNDLLFHNLSDEL